MRCPRWESVRCTLAGGGLTAQDSAQGGPDSTWPGGRHRSGPLHIAVGDLCTIGVTLDVQYLLL